ncbi:MAG: exported protein of unknown function [Candidatus Saccharibacteria bacterium]|nr:exported protein of unknown function [Candidatus Saccharibacteria bacterium]
MWWAIFKYAKVLFVAVLAVLLFTTSVQAWSVHTTPEYRLSEVKENNPQPCSGMYGDIRLNNGGSVQACIMGTATQVASYFPAQGGVAYAIRFPFTTNFYHLDVCQGVWGCVYSEEADVLAGIPGGYTQFVKSLEKKVINGVVRYVPKDVSRYFSISQFGGKQFLPQSVAVSANGKWLLVEMRDYGIFRINVQTLENRRVMAPGYAYGYGYDPRLEMAISNNGATIAVMGTRAALRVIAINDTCGDRPTSLMETNYTGAVRACDYLDTPTESYIPGFFHAIRPHFRKDGLMLAFDVYSSLTAPQHVSLFSNTTTAPSDNRYVALGDSFTSGEGELDDSRYLGGAVNKCHVSSRSYPYLLATPWNVSSLSLACSGATMDSSLGSVLKTNQPVQLDELETHFPNITTVGIGGNDAGLIGKLKDCVGPATCEWAETPEARRATATEIKNLFPRLRSFYKAAKLRTSGPVIVIGYPLIISIEVECIDPVGLLLNEIERLFMNEAVHYLNEVIRAAANDAGVEYADVEYAFNGEFLCSSLSSPVMNGIRLGDDYPNLTTLPFLKIIGSESFHPKPEGHVKLANKIVQDYPNWKRIDGCGSCNIPRSAPEPSDYWDGQNTQPTRYALPFLKANSAKTADMFDISLPAFSFAPLSDVIFELHSVVKNLGTVKAAEDGSVHVSIPAIAAEPGFHSIRAIGKDFTGNNIEVYDFVTIEEDSVVDIVPSSDIRSNSTPLVLEENLTKAISSDPSADVLGVSVAGPPNLAVNTKQTKNPIHPIGTHKQPLSNGLLFGVICGAVFIAVGVLAYAYYRQKRSRIEAR